MTYNNHPLIVINLTQTSMITLSGFHCICLEQIIGLIGMLSCCYTIIRIHPLSKGMSENFMAIQFLRYFRSDEFGPTHGPLDRQNNISSAKLIEHRHASHLLSKSANDIQNNLVLFLTTCVINVNASPC